jgi:hypothetical protein
MRHENLEPLWCAQQICVAGKQVPKEAVKGLYHKPRTEVVRDLLVPRLHQSRHCGAGETKKQN